jgi:hypothetical protein
LKKLNKLIQKGNKQYSPNLEKGRKKA